MDEGKKTFNFTCHSFTSILNQTDTSQKKFSWLSPIAFNFLFRLKFSSDEFSSRSIFTVLLFVFRTLYVCVQNNFVWSTYFFFFFWFMKNMPALANCSVKQIRQIRKKQLCVTNGDGNVIRWQQCTMKWERDNRTKIHRDEGEAIKKIIEECVHERIGRFHSILFSCLSHNTFQ